MTTAILFAKQSDSTIVGVHSNVPVKKDSIVDFKNWFNKSNRAISKNDGYRSRRLLESEDSTRTI